MTDYAPLLPTATAGQRRVLEALIKYGTYVQAAAALGLNQSTVQRHVHHAKARHARQDPAPHSAGAPEGYHLSGVSTFTKDAQGNPQWVKTRANLPDPAEYAARVEDALSTLRGVKPRPAPKVSKDLSNLLTVIPIGDPHFGMLAWPAETGDAWDLKIAAQVHRDAIARLLERAPRAAEALIVWMGDNAHADDARGVTPASGHHLDVDSRWGRMLDILVAAMVNSVDQALETHARVRLRVVLGNHDPHVSAALALAVACHYRTEPRVTVDRTPVPLYVTTWGRVLLCFAHGHAPQPERIPDILAADYRKEMGATGQAYAWTGHLHSKILRERGGVIFEAVQTLAPKDAYATHAGFRSGRGILAVTYDKRCLTETTRVTVAAQEVEK